MARQEKIVDLKYDRIIHETESAILFFFDADKCEVWLPRSWIEVNEHDQVVSLPERRAIEKEIEGFAV